MHQFVTPVRAVLLALVVAGGMGASILVTPGAAQVGTFESAKDYNPDREECKFLDEINDYRRRNNKPELVLLATLGAAANHHSADMAKHNYFSHTLKGEGISWKKNIRRHGYDGDPIAENILAGTNWESAKEAFENWRRSDGHRRNMLNGDFRAIGIGREYERNSRYQWYWTTTFGGEVEGKEVNC